MITLNNFTKLDNNQYQMILSMKKTDSVEGLPSETRPMSPEYFAVTVDYGVPADGSIVIKESGEILTYSAGEWGKAGTAGDIKLKELSVKENGEYLPESGYVGFNKVVVDVKPKVVMPVKGDLITLDGKQYRVLKTNDTVAEVVSVYRADLRGEFDWGESNIYANSDLDSHYLSDRFYNSLNTSIQNAIIEKIFTQDEWAFAGDANSGTCSVIYHGAYRTPAMDYKIGLANTAYGESISRKCYVLSVQDIIDYLEVTPAMTVENTTLTPGNLRKMFKSQEEDYMPSLWFRSAALNRSDAAFTYNRNEGYLSPSRTVGELYFCPAFQIDLSKVEWAKSE